LDKKAGTPQSTQHFIGPAVMVSVNVKTNVASPKDVVYSLQKETTYFRPLALHHPVFWQDLLFLKNLRRI